MLSELETHLAEALRGALPQAEVSAGPPPPAAAAKPAVNIHALGWRVLAPAGEEPEGKREAARRTLCRALAGDGTTLDFPLDGRDGELAEVELAPGRLARPGDDWRVEDGVLRFYRPPAADFKVLLRGGPAPGYRETARAVASLALTVLDGQAAQADAAANTALAALLAFFVDLDFLTLAAVPDLGLGLRLLRPQADVQALKRDAVPAGPGSLFRSTLRLALRGDLETTLALAKTPEHENLITGLEGTLDTGAGAPGRFSVRPPPKK